MQARDYTDEDDLSRGSGDPDQSPGGKWIVGQPQTERSVEEEIHWALKQELGYKSAPAKKYELGDQMADHSDDQEYDYPGEER